MLLHTKQPFVNATAQKRSYLLMLLHTKQLLVISYINYSVISERCFKHFVS
jgi:hypothetical protein